MLKERNKKAHCAVPKIPSHPTQVHIPKIFVKRIPFLRKNLIPEEKSHFEKSWFEVSKTKFSLKKCARSAKFALTLAYNGGPNILKPLKPCYCLRISICIEPKFCQDFISDVTSGEIGNLLPVYYKNT